MKKHAITADERRIVLASLLLSWQRLWCGDFDSEHEGVPRRGPLPAPPSATRAFTSA